MWTLSTAQVKPKDFVLLNSFKKFKERKKELKKKNEKI